MFEVALTVEGYQSSGNATINSHTLRIGNTTYGGSGGGGTNPTPTPTPTATPTPNVTTIQCENMQREGQYAGPISSPFNGVALYANSDLVRFNHNFTKASNSFTLRGASNNNNTAKVELIIDGQHRGVFNFNGTAASLQSLNNINTGTGNKTVQLKCYQDNGTWDAFIDYLEIR
jgi:endo-1,4-beta-xylanase